MFALKFEDRLTAWKSFRETLEVSPDPFQDVIDFYNKAPRTNIHADPYDRSTWPTPWELLEENQYCEFCRVLGLCYSLQLTERFSGSDCEIHIGIDRKESRIVYLLQIENSILGWYNENAISTKKLPKSFELEKKYHLEKLN